MNVIFKNKRILITGHTGFKGSWLITWLVNLGAEVYGYALEPVENSLFKLLNVDSLINHRVGDIRDLDHLRQIIKNIKPDLIFHLAAQAEVRESYNSPVETIQVNTLGTINLLEAVRKEELPTALVLVTTDKCYDNKEWIFGYRENDAMGGYDPYSASKGAAELLIASWRNSFFNVSSVAKHGVRIASARAGNVIGGGDWAKDRIVPDSIRALQQGKTVYVRSPLSTRPWQHVLEPLSGYLKLGAKLLSSPLTEVGPYCEAFNFGPPVSSNQNVQMLVEKIIQYWGCGSWQHATPEQAFYESSLLHLSIDKAYHRLQWVPRWDFEETVRRTVEWYKLVTQDPSRSLELTLEQIRLYEAAEADAGIPGVYKSKVEITDQKSL